MSVLLALAIIVAIIAVAIRRNNNVKAAAVVATTEVVASNAAASVAHTQDVCDQINDCNAVDYSVMVALVYILMYTKIALKAHKRHVRTVQGKLAHKAACAHIRAQREARSNAMGYVTSANIKAVARADERKALVRAHKAPAATYGDITVSAGIKAAWRTKHPVAKVVTKVVKVVGAGVSKPAVARTYVRHARAANKPILSGTQLAQQARATGTSLAAQIRVAKDTLASLYAILPLARQVVALQSKADRKVGMYNWLAQEGHVGIRSTKPSSDRRDVAQELVCKAILAEEAFKKAYGIEAQDVVSQILAVKASKARAVEMLRNHKAEQHRLFVERQERRAAKAALKAAKVPTAAAPTAAPAVTEVADWEKYVPVNNANKAIACKFIVAKNATIAQKAAAIAAINGVSQQNHNLAGKCTADAAYMVAA